MSEQTLPSAIEKLAFKTPGLLDNWQGMKIEIPVDKEDRHFVEDDHAVTRTTGLGGWGGSFGAGGYGQYDKAAIARMDTSRDERRGVMAVRDGKALRAAVVGVRKRLASVWSGKGTAAERRAVLFELWDECAEDGPEAVVEAAWQVRRAIVAFVREKLPRGSRDGFAADELTRLNRRRTSRASFEPYVYAAP